MAKPPIVGTVASISKRGTELHLQNDPRRYRGVTLAARMSGSRTYPIFRDRGLAVGQVVRLHWGGFADLNIARVTVVVASTPDQVRAV